MRKPVTPAKTIVAAGLLAGTLDIVTACTHYALRTGKNPVAVLRFVASGVFGQDAFTGSSLMPIWGLLFHYLIAFSFTVVFFWLYPRLRLFALNRYLLAILFGLFIWTVMNLLVVPLSNTPKGPFNWSSALQNMAILIIMIGVPLSLIAARQWKVGSRI